ncbi:MAG: hypothetical protein JST11_02685 [Acidobacteria bacterium]|nr:hypothetical protein [Acidobacteriota bacterium]
MNLAAAGSTRTVPEPFGRAVPLVRRLLLSAGLSVVEEFNVSGESYFRLGVASRSCIVLLVDSPVLLFEAIALDRAAAVFLPVHVVITGDRDTSYIHWANPVASSGLRPPVPAKGALEELCGRVHQALAALPRAVDHAVVR